MSEKNDGGPAFPHVYEVDGPPAGAVPGRWYKSEPGKGIAKGISARDYFAGKAMQGIVGGITAARSAVEEKHVAGLARMSYLIADAMLAERDK